MSTTVSFGGESVTTDWPATNYTDEPTMALARSAAERLMPFARSLRENFWVVDVVMRQDPDSKRVTMSVEVELRPALPTPDPEETG